MAKKIIGIFGAGRITQAENVWQSAFIMGRLLAEQGFVVLTGGLGGVMEAASRGAREAGGVTVGILPGTRSTTPANQYVDIAVYTGTANMAPFRRLPWPSKGIVPLFFSTRGTLFHMKL